jgi:hypothetical protein
MIILLCLTLVCGDFGIVGVYSGASVAALPRDTGAALCTTVGPASGQQCGLGINAVCAGNATGCPPCGGSVGQFAVTRVGPFNRSF